MMQKPLSLRNALYSVALSAIVMMIVGMILVVLIHFDTDAAGPQQVFESHLAALDAQDVETAGQFTLDECSLPDELPDFAYQDSFQVKEVWISGDGDEAILGLTVPVGLPNIALLEKVEGEWLITC